MERQYSGVYWKIYDAVAQQHPRVISNRGGARSTKTYSTLQFLNDVLPFDKAGEVTSVVSETLPHLKKGAVRDFERILGHPLKMDTRWNASELTYTYPSGAKLEFFSADSPGKVQGPARKRLFVNEANHISYETYRQLAIRTSGRIFIDYNPTASFWATDIVEAQPSTVTIHSTFLDNPFLTPEQVAEIRSNEGDAAWWQVFGLGQIGKLEGVIYDFEQVDGMPDAAGLVEVYGLDFGFTNDPTACVRLLLDTRQRIAYVQQIIYRRGMLNADISNALEAGGCRKRGPMLFADCAEPKTIEELYRAGWNVFPCYKATRKAEQINYLKGWRLRVTKDSTDVIRELRGYVWAQDKNGHELNEPIGVNDHAMDALRYALYTYMQKHGGGTFRLGFGSDYE